MPAKKIQEKTPDQIVALFNTRAEANPEATVVQVYMGFKNTEEERTHIAKSPEVLDKTLLAILGKTTTEGGFLQNYTGDIKQVFYPLSAIKRTYSKLTAPCEKTLIVPSYI